MRHLMVILAASDLKKSILPKCYLTTSVGLLTDSGDDSVIAVTQCIALQINHTKSVNFTDNVLE